jgi:creatinine amidohydrolase
MLAISPGRVRRPLAQPGNTTALAELLPRLRAEGVRAASPSGVLGDPTGASGGEGEELLATALDELLLVVDEFAQRKEPTCPELP